MRGDVRLERVSLPRVLGGEDRDDRLDPRADPAAQEFTALAVRAAEELAEAASDARSLLLQLQRAKRSIVLVVR